ncbi:CopG family transcriptional regulator [Sphingomonas ursincola]|uniref:CopG family transcriptional regulator n=1 Tax=Sphingomonas ursincola TaxID=56361 RepID=A0A7V8U733_9SPHN|nr:CopG family transcriptional regulator [Sphingomonas ursincola]
MSTLNEHKKRMGRPPVDSEPVRLRMERADLDALDQWREAQPDLPARPEAARRLIRKALDQNSE